jgi:hypothetical protein
VLGFFGTVFGGWHCVKGHNYSVAAQHESTTVGRVVKILTGKGGPDYRYEFSVNGVRMDDFSEICATPLAPGACNKEGPVLVYYSFQPYSNSRLEDFAVASAHAYRIGAPALAIGLPLFVLSIAALVVMARADKRDNDSNPDKGKRRSKSDDVPDVIHIVPGE